MPKLPRLLKALIPLSLALACIPALRADEPDIIAKARSYLGSEEKLNAVKSIHLTGRIVTSEGKSIAVEIIFGRPCRQRISATGPESIEITALDGYDAWQRLQDARDAKRWKLTLLEADQVKRLRANTLESLGFYRSVPASQVSDLGLVDFEGAKARKVAFAHPGGIVFYRLFDPATGRLLITETESGGSIRESGEILVDGLRFAKKISTTSPATAGGPGSTVTVEFDKISVNGTLADSLFAVPLLRDS